MRDLSEQLEDRSFDRREAGSRGGPLREPGELGGCGGDAARERVSRRMLLIGSIGRAVLGAVFVVVGLLMLVFNRRVTEALVAGQRDGFGALLGGRRGVTDRLHSSRPFLIAARTFVVLFSLAWTALAVGLIVTPG